MKDSIVADPRMVDQAITSHRLELWVPGLKTLRTYQREWFRSDLVAGVSVAAVAIPIGIAYSQLAGAPPVVGLYSCVLPPVAYALFGSSRQLVVNPDSAACAIVAATVTPLAAGDPNRYSDLLITLTLLAGLLCIVGGIARLGVIANFLSGPILIGYLNGIALSIIAGQLGKLFGIDVPSAGFFRTVGGLISRLGQTHGPTLMLGASLLLVLLGLKFFLPKIPGPVVAAVLGIGLIYLFNLNRLGIRVIGQLPSGFPLPRIPVISLSDLGALSSGAATIVLVSFCSMMTTARAFAAKNGYHIRPNQDLIALGVCDLAAGLNQGFAVSGADSRTAVADSAGGKTQVTSVIASATMLIVLLFLTAPLSYLPAAGLAAILISSAIGLFDFAALLRYFRISKAEFGHALVAMLGVMTVGILPGILVAVFLSLARLIVMASHPHDAVLGVTPDGAGFHNMATEPTARPVPGMLIYRFDSSLLFFNAGRFEDRLKSVIHELPEKPQLVILSAESMPILDTTGADTLSSIHTALGRQGIVLGIARAKGFFRLMMERSGLAEQVRPEYLFPTVQAAVDAHNQRHTGRQGEQTQPGEQK